MDTGNAAAIERDTSAYRLQAAVTLAVNAAEHLTLVSVASRQAGAQINELMTATEAFVDSAQEAARAAERAAAEAMETATLVRQALHETLLARESAAREAAAARTSAVFSSIIAGVLSAALVLSWQRASS